MDKFIDVASKHEIKLDNKELKVAIRDLMDETLGFNLPFTLLNNEMFNKELTYYNAKKQTRAQSQSF